MLTSLRVTGFRDLKSLRVDSLARVNLFVGTNNCGKTSLLEAIEIFLGGGRSEALFAGSLRREETMRTPQGSMVDVCHLFHGHSFEGDASFSIKGVNGGPRAVHVRVGTLDHSAHFDATSQMRLLDEPTQASSHGSLRETSEETRWLEDRVALLVEPRGWSTDRYAIPLTAEGGVPVGVLSPRLIRTRRSPSERPTYNFITTSGLDLRHLVQLWDGIVLSPEEELVLDSLRIIEPDLERLAAVDREVSSGAFMLLRRGSDRRIPLGSMGDGLRRLLAIAVCLGRAAGSSLLIDEIDTGLHHSVMTRMWRLVIETAVRRNIQVFATTHSDDCVRSLAALAGDDPELGEQVTLHRVEKGRVETTPYDADELRQVIDGDIEVRG